MLHLDGNRFTSGRARFNDHLPEVAEPTAKIYVQVRLGPSGPKLLAQLDTGAAWSVLAPETAKRAQVTVEGGVPMTMRTPLGLKQGLLVQLPLILIAEEGESLETEATFFIPSDWPKDLNFLGYSGLLSKIRFAVDPEANHFYFGPSAGRL